MVRNLLPNWTQTDLWTNNGTNVILETKCNWFLINESFFFLVTRKKTQKITFALQRQRIWTQIKLRKSQKYSLKMKRVKNIAKNLLFFVLNVIFFVWFWFNIYWMHLYHFYDCRFRIVRFFSFFIRFWIGSSWKREIKADFFSVVRNENGGQ